VNRLLVPREDAYEGMAKVYTGKAA
jgi:hypothetical protein